MKFGSLKILSVSNINICIFFTLNFSLSFSTNYSSPVGLGCRIYQLHLCRGVRPPNECPRLKPSDGKALALELCRMWSTPLLPLLGPILIWSGCT